LIVGDPQLAVGWVEASASATLGPATTGSPRRDADASEPDLVPRSLKSLLQALKSETEKNAIAAALEKTRWNRKAAANLLKVSYRSMLYKIDQYEINRSEPDTSSFPEFRVLGPGNGKLL
jgi:DNA-binding NtrC family response regulator